MNETTPERKIGPRLVATFRPQQWFNNYAVDVDGQVRFDATDVFLAQKLEAIRLFSTNDFDSDLLASDLPECQEYDGPFEVDLEYEPGEWLELHGLDIKTFSQDDLDWLRETHRHTTLDDPTVVKLGAAQSILNILDDIQTDLNQLRDTTPPELLGDIHPDNLEEMSNLYWEEVGKYVDTLLDRLKTQELEGSSDLRLMSQLGIAINSSEWLNRPRLAIYVLLCSKNPCYGISTFDHKLGKTLATEPFPFCLYAYGPMLLDAWHVLQLRPEYAQLRKRRGD
jgi:hypothetical protein